MTTASTPTPLRVVEIAQGVAGPACGRLFAALGHDVRKCEPPAGDYLREQPLAFVALNADKQSVLADPTTATGRDTVARMLDGADVAVIDLLPDDAVAAGLDPAAIRQRWPDLVAVSITGFGQSGDFAQTPADSLLAESFGGLATMIGAAGRRPLALGGEQAAYCAALTGFLGAMLALLRRDHGQGGDVVDVAMCDVAAYMDWKSDVGFAITGRAPGRAADEGWRLLRARDGWVGAIFEDRHWDAVVELVDQPQLRDPIWRDQVTRIERGSQWWPYVEQWAVQRSAREIYDDARARGLPFGWVATVADLAESPQLLERGFVHPDSPTERPVLASPVRCADLPWRNGPAPRLGTGDVFLPRPVAPQPLSPPAQASPRAEPLAGVTVLDFGAITAGAAVTRLLADYGATVIKIEWIERPDTFRAWKLTSRDADAGGRLPMSPFFPSNNLGKQDVAIDLKTERGRELVHELAARCDVLVENFRVGVTKRLGIDYDTLHRINPDLVYLSLSSQGQFGPEAANSSFGSTLDLLSGLASVSGYEAGRPIWSSSNVNYPDQLVAMFGAAFLAYCLRSGHRGAHLDVSQREVVSWTLGAEIADFLATGTVAATDGNRRPGRAPHDTYPCAEPDTWVAISCSHAAERAGLAGLLAHPEAAHREAAWWLANQDTVDAWITEYTTTLTRDDAVAVLRASGVPAVPVLTAADRAVTARFRDRGVRADGGRYPVKGFPMVFTDYVPPPPSSGAPEIGEHTRAVLAPLGLDDDDLDQLEADRVIHTHRG